MRNLFKANAESARKISDSNPLWFALSTNGGANYPGLCNEEFIAFNQK